MGVKDHGVLLIVEPQAARVEVGASHGAETPVDHYYFCVVEARLIHPHLCSMLHELVYVVEHTVGGERNVAVCGNHDLHLHAALYGVLERFLQRVRQGEVGVYELYAVLGVVDGLQIKLPDDLVRRSRLAVYYAHRLPSGRCRGVGLETFKIGRRVIAPVIFCPLQLLARDLFPYSHEDALQGVDLRAFYAAMHVAP